MGCLFHRRRTVAAGPAGWIRRIGANAGRGKQAIARGETRGETETISRRNGAQRAGDGWACEPSENCGRRGHCFPVRIDQSPVDVREIK